MAKFTKLSLCQNKFFASNFFMQMFNVSIFCRQFVSAKAVVQVDLPPCALSMHRSYKMAKFDKQPFCKKVIFLHDPSSCSLYMYCISKVSESFSKSSGTSWYISTCKQEKMAKFTKLSFCQKIFFWCHTSSCKCSMCLYYADKLSDGFSQMSDTSWFPRAYTIWALTKLFKKQSVKKIATFKNNVILSKCIFIASNFFMQMFNVSTLCMQSISWLQSNVLYKLISFFQEVFLWHQTSSCKCSVCLHLHGKYQNVSVKAVVQVDFLVYALSMHH